MAEALRDWLPVVIQSVQPWISGDIEKGSRWESEVAAKLDEASVGIVCLTPESLKSHWLLFEAGALSKKLSKARVCTYLRGLRPQDVQPPLGMFQHTVAEDKADTWRLVETINRCQEKPVADVPLSQVFELTWPGLDKKLTAIPEPETQGQPKRQTEDMIAEVLEIARGLPSELKAVLRSSVESRTSVRGMGLADPGPVDSGEPSALPSHIADNYTPRLPRFSKPDK
jgi:hypothetical protein